MKKFSFYLLMSSLSFLPLLAANDSQEISKLQPSTIDPDQIYVNSRDPSLNEVLNVMKDNDYGKHNIAEAITKTDKNGIDALGFDHKKYEDQTKRYATKLRLSEIEQLTVHSLEGDINAIHQLLRLAQSNFETETILNIFDQAISSKNKHQAIFAAELLKFYQKNPEMLDQFITDHHRDFGKKYRVLKLGHRDFSNAAQVHKEEHNYIKETYLDELSQKAKG